MTKYRKVSEDRLKRWREWVSMGTAHRLHKKAEKNLTFG